MPDLIWRFGVSKGLKKPTTVAKVFGALFCLGTPPVDYTVFFFLIFDFCIGSAIECAFYLINDQPVPLEAESIKVYPMFVVVHTFTGAFFAIFISVVIRSWYNHFSLYNISTFNWK